MLLPSKNTVQQNHQLSASYNLLSNFEDLFSLNMDHVGLLSAKLILTLLLLCIYLNKYDPGRARPKINVAVEVNFSGVNIFLGLIFGWGEYFSGVIIFQA